MGILTQSSGYLNFIKRARAAGSGGATPPADTVDWKNPWTAGKVPGVAPIPDQPTNLLARYAGTEGTPMAPSPANWRARTIAETPVVANTLVRPNAQPVPEAQSTFTPPAETGPTLVRPNATPTPVSEPTVTPPTPTKEDGLYGNVLDQLAAGINSNRPLPGTDAAITQSRQALATYARAAEARAGMQAAKGGSLGQGTANQMAAGVRGDIMRELADSELDNTKLVSNEKMGLMDKAIQAGQFAQTRGDNMTQFTANLAQRKTEFEKTFGAEESKGYINTLERLATDNPVLATKLTNYLLEGKTGSIGAFTPQEMEQIKTLAAEKKGSQDKLTAVFDKILAGLPAQIDAGNAASVDATKKAEEAKLLEGYTKKLNTLPPGQMLAPEEFKALEAAKTVPRFAVASIPKGTGAVQQLLTQHPSGIISLDGRQFRVVSGGSFGDVASQFVQLVGENGQPYWLDQQGKWYNKQPRGLGPGIKNSEIPPPF